MDYNAFISYSRALDGELAPALQRGLQRLARHWHRRRALEVFRDQTGLPVTPALWSTIRSALDQSEFFVLLASPEAAASRWVNQEIAYWLSAHPVDRFLPVVTSGEWVWDTARGDFDWDLSTAVPSALRGMFHEEPRYLDLRWARSDTQLDLRHGPFRDAVAELAAPMHQMSKEDLDSEDTARHRRMIRLRRGIGAAFCVMLVLIGVAGVIAVRRSQAERRQRAVAEAEQRTAAARQLLAQADAIRDADPRTALMLGIAARHVHPDGETEAGLVNTLTATRYAGALTGSSKTTRILTFSPDGGIAVTGDREGLAVLWDLIGRVTRLGDLQLGDTVLAAAFTLDGRTLAVSTMAGTVTLWDVTDRVAARRLGQPITDPGGRVDKLAFSADGRTLATGGGVTVTLWDVADPTTPRPLGKPLTGGHSVAFTPDGRTVAVGGDGSVTLWDINDRSAPRRLGQVRHLYGAVAEVAFSPDGRSLATLGLYGTAMLWDVADHSAPRQVGQPLVGHPLPKAVIAARFAADGRRLTTASTDGTAIVWDVSDRTTPRRLDQPLTGRPNRLATVVLSPDGRILAITESDGTVSLWRIDDRSAPEPRGQMMMTPNSAGIDTLTLVDGERHLAIVGAAGTAEFWDVANPAAPKRSGPSLNHPDLYLMALTPDGRTAATGGLDGSLNLWDVTDRTAPRRLGEPVAGHTDRLNEATFAPDGRTLATAGSDNTVIVWDVTDPAAPRRVGQPLIGHSANVHTMAFAPGGHTLATGSGPAEALGSDGNVILWDLTNHDAPRRLSQPMTNDTRGVQTMTFSPDGHILAAAGGDVVSLWNVTDRANPRRMSRPLPGGGRLSAIAISADGRTLAAGSMASGGPVVLWDLTDTVTLRPLGWPLHHAASIGAVAFTPDGRMLITGDSTAVTLWDLANLNDLRDHAAERACAIAGRGLNHDEWARFVPGLPHQGTCG